MTENHLYNLMEQLVQEHKSLWRIKKNYGEDANDCDPCQSFWNKMMKDKEDHISEMMKMLKDHL